MDLRSIAFVFVLASTGCQERVATVTKVAPGTLKVTTGRGVSLEVIDWGGSGRALVFLAGAGHTAHEFDEFAPLFVEDFRVLGITRRGIGASSDARPRRFNEFVEDIVAVLDAMKLESVILVGHSFAGLEMAMFGEKYSGRCMGLVYLDSAYDYTDPELARIFEATPPPHAPPMQTADSASVSAVRAYVERTQAMRMPESEIRSTRRFGSNGRLIGVAPRASAGWRIANRTPRWESVDCPSLGIYAVPAPPETWLPYYSELDSVERGRATAYFRSFARWTAKSRRRFAQFPQNKVIEFPSSNHYFFLEKPDESSRAMRDFLLKLH